jgi:hypothetical protein
MPQTGAVSWTFTDDVQQYAPHAEAALGDDPERHTIGLGVVAQALGGHETPDSLYAWWTDANGAVTGTMSQTPPYEPLVERAPEESFTSLVRGVVERRGAFTGLNAPTDIALPLAAVATHETGGTAVLGHATRLFRCAGLTTPAPFPDGSARPAEEPDVPLVVAWYRAFSEESGAPMAEDVEHSVRVRMQTGDLVLWCDDRGDPVSLAGATGPAFGVSRVGPVYTPPAMRRRGYGAAVTHEVTRQVLARGHRSVLFTDLANPTSNALYPRLGYRPVADRAWFEVVMDGSAA